MKKLMIRLNACKESIDWVGDRDLVTAWNDCERADWMLWFAAKVGVDRKLIVTAACDCAETSLQYVKPSEERPLIAIETARRWIRGEATIEEVKSTANAARAAAYAARAAYAAYDADADAANAAANAAYDAAASYDAANADADAAAASYDAAYAAAAYAAAYARTTHLKEMTSLVRNQIPLEAVINASEGK